MSKLGRLQNFNEGVFLPLRVLTNLMRVYFLPVRLIIADVMKVCFHTLRVRVLAIIRTFFFEPVTLSVYHDLNEAKRESPLLLYVLDCQRMYDRRGAAQAISL